jgi:hypothetical protein
MKKIILSAALLVGSVSVVAGGWWSSSKKEEATEEPAIEKNEIPSGFDDENPQYNPGTITPASNQNGKNPMEESILLE